MIVPPTDALVVFLLIGGALVLFLTETFSPDVTAIGVLVSLVVFQRWTGISSTEALQGFANPATVTIIAMYILSEGIRQTGLVSRLGHAIRGYAGDNERKLLGTMIGTTGLGAGFINNTPIVAVFIPMVTEISEETGISPSKLLLPLSYAAMLGGTLTLLGTATNILISEYAVEFLGRPIGMFEFTPLGIVILAVGTVYLLTVGRWLTPARVRSAETSIEAFGLQRNLSQVVVKEDSPLVGLPLETVRQASDSNDLSTVISGDSKVKAEEIDAGFDLDILQLARYGEQTLSLDSERPVKGGDVMTVRVNRQEVNRFADVFGLRQLPRKVVTEADIQARPERGRLIEVALPEGSRLVGDTVAEANLAAYHNATVLALRSGDSIVHRGLSDRKLGVGDSILLQVRERDLRYLIENRDVIVVRGVGPRDREQASQIPELSSDTPLAVGILAGVVIAGAFQIVPIVIAALGGVVLMFAFDVVRPRDAYRAVGWNVVFLLAGVIPLGTALQLSGGVDVIASIVVALATILPPLAVLGLFYVLTNLFANVITPVATVVLLAPIAVDTASRLGLNELSFLFSILFAASTAFVTPIGYQTNMMVYGPGGYRFTDYLRVGAPLQFVLAIVTTLGIAVLWGL